MQIASLRRGVARIRTKVAPAGAGAVVPAHGGNGCQRALDRNPTVAWTRPAIGEYRLGVLNSRVNGPVGAAFQDHGGLPHAGAIDIEHPTADIHRTADLRKMLPVPRTLCLLVNKPGDKRDCKDAGRNGRGGKCCRSQLRRHRVLQLFDTELLLRVPLLRASTDRGLRPVSAGRRASGRFRPAKPSGRVTPVADILPGEHVPEESSCRKLDAFDRTKCSGCSGREGLAGPCGGSPGARIATDIHK